MPAHVSTSMLNVLCARHHNRIWACKRISSISFSSPPFICHVVHSCAIAQVHMSKHVIVLQAVLHEGCFTSWWERELLDIKDHSILRNNDSFLWSSCSLLKLSVILDNIMLRMVHKFSPSGNIFISYVCMPKILDFAQHRKQMLLDLNRSCSLPFHRTVF